MQFGMMVSGFLGQTSIAVRNPYQAPAPCNSAPIKIHEKEIRIMKTFDKILYAIVLIGVPASYILNFGWFRFVLVVVFIPYYFIYAILNHLFIKLCPEKSMFGHILFAVSGISFLGANILLLDGGDIGPNYVCFGLIKLNDQDSNLMTFFGAALSIHLLATVLQIILMIRFENRINK